MVAFSPNKLGKPMPDDELRAAVRQEIRTAIGHIGGEVVEQRRKAMEYYLAMPFGNEQEDRSQVVMSDVQDVIEGVMPDFLEIFHGSDEVVKFEATGTTDLQQQEVREKRADQATDYVNYVWLHDNDGFGNTHDWIKDSLLQINGIIKIYWDDSERIEEETYENLTMDVMQEYEADESIEILEANPSEPSEMVMQAAQQGIELWDAKVRKTNEEGRAKVVTIPPEEFLIARRAINLDQAPFTCHRVERTVSEMIEMGYSMEDMEDVPSHDDMDYNEERVTRFHRDDEWPELDTSLDPAMRDIWVYECYMKVDVDGDGIAEMRHLTVAGPGYKLLPDPDTGDTSIKVDEHPFETMTPIRMPHKFFGRSLAELVQDVQLIKSTIVRQWLDNTYYLNNARTGISKKVDLDDYLTQRPGSVVRVDTDNADVGGHIVPIPTMPIGQSVFPLIEYMDSVRETRTGVTRYNQGLDADSLNKTATGINQILGRAQRRIMLMARVFAEMGFKRAHSKLLRLLVAHQNAPRVIKLRGEWVTMDPRTWDSKMQANVEVGLGYGTKQEQFAMMERILGIQIQALELQGGANGPIVKLDNIFATLKKMTSAAGIKNTASHFTDPADAEQQQPQEPKPDPDMVKAQSDIQIAQQKAQADTQAKQMQAQANMQIKAQEAQADAQLAQQKAMADDQLKRQEMALEHERALLKMQGELEIMRAKATLDAEIAASNANLSQAITSAEAQSRHEAAEGNALR